MSHYLSVHMQGKIVIFLTRNILLKNLFLFVLRFYGPVNPIGLCWAWSIYLTTLLLGRLRPLSGWPVLCTFFARNWQLPFLNQRKGENDRRKYFMINLIERILPTQRGCRTCNLLITSPTCIQLNHRGPPNEDTQSWSTALSRHQKKEWWTNNDTANATYDYEKYSNIPPKKENFQIKILIFFIFLLKT